MPYLKRIPESPEPIDCRILTAALNLFVANGYHKVSVHHIQKPANVSIGSIYNHFSGKDGIAKSLYYHIIKEIDELVDDVVSEYDSPLKQIEVIIRQLFDHTESHSNIIASAFHAKHPEFLHEEDLICKTAPFIKIKDIVEAAMDQDEIRRTNTWVATSTIFGGMIRMIQLRLDGVIEEPLSEYYSMLIDTVLGGLQKPNDIGDKSVAIAAVR
ncbi:MAG: AcrR family transcriptional regulator [Cocleimonas sp.]|jgi:AcrR family transcriptional regulator